jgi:hypothetical protein
MQVLSAALEEGGVGKDPGEAEVTQRYPQLFPRDAFRGGFRVLADADMRCRENLVSGIEGLVRRCHEVQVLPRRWIRHASDEESLVVH